MRNLLQFLVFLMPFWASAQTNPECYVLKSDATGFERTYQTALNPIACEIATLLEKPNDFKVFDYGLYLHLTAITGAKEDALMKIKGLADNASPYYMIVTKIPSYDKVIDKFDVKLKLPSEGKFTCLTQSKVALIILKVQNTINIYHKSHPSTDFRNTIEIGLIELKKYYKM